MTSTVRFKCFFGAKWYLSQLQLYPMLHDFELEVVVFCNRHSPQLFMLALKISCLWADDYAFEYNIKKVR